MNTEAVLRNLLQALDDDCRDSLTWDRLMTEAREVLMATADRRLTDEQIAEVAFRVVYQGIQTAWQAEWVRDVGLPFARAIEALVQPQ